MNNSWFFPNEGSGGTGPCLVFFLFCNSYVKFGITYSFYVQYELLSMHLDFFSSSSRYPFDVCDCLKTWDPN